MRSRLTPREFPKWSDHEPPPYTLKTISGNCFQEDIHFAAIFGVGFLSGGQKTIGKILVAKIGFDTAEKEPS